MNGNSISIDRALYSYNQKLYCTILVNEKSLHEIIPEYAIGLRENPEHSLFSGELPKPGSNPIRALPKEKSPMLANITYPSPETVYQKKSAEQRAACKALYSDTHINRKTLSVSFNEFIKSSSFGEGVFELVADAGIGKTWWLSHKLSSIAENRKNIDVIYFDLRSRGISKINEYIDFHFALQANQFLLVSDLKTYLVENDLNDKYNRNDVRHKDLYDYYSARINSNTEYERDYRLEYYSKRTDLKLLIAVDNIEKLSNRELEKLYERLADRFALKQNVALVIPMRPSTLSIKDRISNGAMNVHTRENLQSPSLEDICRKRVRTNYMGQEIGNPAVLRDKSDFPKIIQTIFHVVDRRSDFSTGEFLRQLCSYRGAEGTYVDVRHFIRPLRSLLNSRIMDTIDKYSDVYFCTHALMSNNSDETDEHKSYLFNLINDPHSVGNGAFPLSRIRVLEYIKLFQPNEENLRRFGICMKYADELIFKIVDEYERAGLVVKNFTEKGANLYRIDIPGELHLGLVKNPWYIIMCKTSICAYPDSVVYRDVARKMAVEEGLGDLYVQHYEKTGWIPDRHLIKFLKNEEYLERKRLSECKDGQDRDWIVKIYENLSCPSQIVTNRLKFGKKVP